MEIEKKISNFNDGSFTAIMLKKENSYMEILLGGNLDLYFKFYSRVGNTFEINKDDNVYQSFLDLYNKIKDNNVFEVNKNEILDVTPEEVEYQYDLMNELNERAKSRGHYKELFKNEIVTFKTDSSDVSKDYMKIEKDDENIKFTFNNYASIVKVCNSGSYYDPYNILFMQCFSDLMKNNEKSKVLKR